MKLSRLPLIRHIRYFWFKRKVYQWAATWGDYGVGLGYPHELDLERLDAIWRGEA